ncbi:MAG: hypothetical protein RLZZ127_1393 [Planctomycetota bacterium]|jgi:colicin import membrane protein
MADYLRIKFTRECFSSGERYNAGAIADLPVSEARQLIGMHAAERCELTDEEAAAAVAAAEKAAAAKANAQAEAEAKAKAQAEAEAAARADAADREAAAAASADKK